MKLAIFSHGKESGPNGTKINKLRKVAESQGFETISVDYQQCKNASERVILLKETIATQKVEKLVLIGSSMGGYVSTAVANDYSLDGLFLLCPALWMDSEEYEVQSYQPKCNHIEITHGWNDDIVPFESSIKFGQQVKATVNLVDDNHRLEASHGFLEKRFGLFLREIE